MEGRKAENERNKKDERNLKKSHQNKRKKAKRMKRKKNMLNNSRTCVKKCDNKNKKKTKRSDIQVKFCQNNIFIFSICRLFSFSPTVIFARQTKIF